jgi:hypothetical protein
MLPRATALAIDWEMPAMTTMLICAVTLLAAILLVASFRYASKRRIVSKRERKQMWKIHEAVSKEVSLEALTEVLQSVGRAYAIDPALVRPDDALEKFVAADTWTLGAGTEQLDEWLISKGLGHEPVHAKTVLDLARLLENRTGGRLPGEG